MNRSRLRPWLYAFGVVLAVGTLVGSRFLSPGAGGPDATPDQVKTKLQEANAPARSGAGPVVLGFVDTDPPVTTYGLPPNMQTGLVAKVFVKEREEVKAGAELFAFDSTVQRATYQKALDAVEVAKKEAEVAKATARDHESKIRLAEESVKAAELRVKLSKETYRVTKYGLEKTFRASFAPEEVVTRLENDARLLELDAATQTAERELELRKAERDSVKHSQVPAATAAKAEAGVHLAEAVANEAKAGLDLCTVRAHLAGVVERLTVSPGDVLGIGSRTPALWFVPSGPRIVRAEVEPEFAHRVLVEVQAGGTAKNRELTVYDNTDSKLTYKGVLRPGGIGTSFLPKRSGGEGLVNNDTRVLECVIEVADWAPAGKPPLRVGQKVRVNFGQ